MLSGCSSFFNPPPLYPPALPPDIPPPPKVNGTIYQSGHDIRLYEDKVARRVGDVLTVRLEESTKGEYKGKTKTDKRAQLTYPVPVVFGQSVPALEVKTNTQQVFDATGLSDESDKLIGTISVTVNAVLPNGNLMVQGESWVSLNQGIKYLQLSGIVRQIDIEPNNFVSSQRIAAAKINYGAEGQAGYATSGGLITRLFNRFAPY
jgi:flagellar L-ring protein precursor FlgH